MRWDSAICVVGLASSRAESKCVYYVMYLVELASILLFSAGSRLAFWEYRLKTLQPVITKSQFMSS